MRGTAAFSSDRRYRYRLTRTWGRGPRVCFVMLNPSTADAASDDPTIRRCIAFARRWGYGGLDVVNLFAYRSTRPEELRQIGDPIGTLNDRYIRRAHAASSLTVAGWGADAAAADRARQVVELLGGGIACIGTTVGGAPRHPLYLKGSLRPRTWMSRRCIDGRRAEVPERAAGPIARRTGTGSAAARAARARRTRG